MSLQDEARHAANNKRALRECATPYVPDYDAIDLEADADLFDRLAADLDRLQPYVDQPLDRDFYRCPNTDQLVYRWADERHVLVRAADLGRTIDALKFYAEVVREASHAKELLGSAKSIDGIYGEWMPSEVHDAYHVLDVALRSRSVDGGGDKPCP